MNILVIDSENPYSQELVNVLSDWGYGAAHALSAGQASDRVKKDLFELILMELFLEDAMGYEIVPELKLFNPGVSVIMMSRKSSPELEKRSRESGIIYFMEKPVPYDHLKLIIDQLIKKRI